MDDPTQEHRDYGFVIGLMAGTVVGAGLMLWLAPRMISEIGQRMSETAKSLRQRAADEYDRASTRASEKLDELTRKGQAVRDDVADAVARSAHSVERYATAAKSDRGASASSHTAADGKGSAESTG